MSVRLISISRPVIEDVPGTQELLAFFARVSSTANQLKHETGPKLIKSLVARKEWSPLEMVSLTVEIVTTRDIARQILRHRSFSFQEFSQRYAVVEDAPVFREARLQDHKDRQNSIELTEEDHRHFKGMWTDEQSRVWELANEVYKKAIDDGIAKEVARAVLPEGLTVSRLYMAGTLRSFLHYCALRCEQKTQKEHRLIADQVKSILIDQFTAIADVI